MVPYHTLPYHAMVLTLLWLIYRPSLPAPMHCTVWHQNFRYFTLHRSTVRYSRLGFYCVSYSPVTVTLHLVLPKSSFSVFVKFLLLQGHFYEKWNTLHSSRQCITEEGGHCFECVGMVGLSVIYGSWGCDHTQPPPNQWITMFRLLQNHQGFRCFFMIISASYWSWWKVVSDHGHTATNPM